MPWRMGLRAVLFDIDDTLTDYRGIVNAAMAAVYDLLAARGFTVARDAFLAHFWAIKREVEQQAERAGWDIHEVRRQWMIATLAACGCPDAADPNALTEHYAAARDRTVVYHPGAEAAIARLRQAYRLGIISGGATRLDVFTLGQQFHDALFSYQTGLWKPDPAVFRAAVERLGCAPEEAVYVGDDPERDVAGARGAGLHAVWFNPNSRAYPPGLPPPDYVSASLEDIAAFLLAGRGEP